jgi:hypothetical protein
MSTYFFIEWSFSLHQNMTGFCRDYTITTKKNAEYNYYGLGHDFRMDAKLQILSMHFCCEMEEKLFKEHSIKLERNKRKMEKRKQQPFEQ